MSSHENILRKVEELVRKSEHSATNVTEYMGPSLRIFSEVTGQRTKYSGFNWDTRVRSRSAKYTVIVGSNKVAQKQLKPEQQETMDEMNANLARIFGGSADGKNYVGHVNNLPIDYVHRVMGSGADPNFTFNCNLLVTTKNPVYHHIGYMWGKMLREVDAVKDAPDLYILMVPDINTGTFGRFYSFPEINTTVGLGSDYMGEAKKGFLRMAMYQAKQKGILGIHAASKVVRAEDVHEERIKTYGVLVLGLSGTGKTTNAGHTHYLDRDGEAALLVQDDFVGLRMADGTVLGTEQALFLKTDLDDDDLLLKPATKSPDFTGQNVYVNASGSIGYLEEDICANGRGILPLTSLPKSRVYDSIDLPSLDDIDGLYIFLNTRRNTVVPILQELNSPEQAAGYFMLGESIETAAGDPAKAGQSLRVVGTNPFIVGPEGEEGNMFYEFVKRYQDKVRCFIMNTGGVGELRDPKDPTKVIKEPARPWKSGIGYITRAVFRNTARWADSPDFGTRVLVGGVTDIHGERYGMVQLDPNQVYDSAEVRDKMVTDLNKERIACLEKFPTLDENILAAMKASLRIK